VSGIRSEIFGADGAAILARQLSIPEKTWIHYESGVLIPACVLLEFIELTGVNPHWLLTGKGQRYLSQSPTLDQGASL